MTALSTTPGSTGTAGTGDASMTYRGLGRTGLRVSAVALGTWATLGQGVDERTGIDILDTAYRSGVNLFDTAETYADGNAETALGRALGRLAWPRETYAVCAKVFWGVHGAAYPSSRGLSRKHVVEGCHASLRRLGLDHLDLLLCHRPDPDTPLEETVRAMSDLITAGTVLYWGTSEWEPDRVAAAMQVADRIGGHRPVTEQLQHNLFRPHRVRRDFAPLVRRTGLGVMAWSPLAYGLLAGRYDGGVPSGSRLARPEYGWLHDEAFHGGRERTLARAHAFGVLADQAGVPPAVLALCWVLRDETVSTAICGASTVRHIATNVRAGSGIDADAELWRRVEELFDVTPSEGQDEDQ